MRFHIFNNTIPTEEGMSGSDKRALEYTRCFIKAGHEVTLILPQIALRRFENTGTRFLVTDKSPHPRRPSPFFLLKRAIAANQACKAERLSQNDIVYSTSDLIADSLPALILKKNNPYARLVCGMHLMAPHPLKGFKKAYTKGFTLPTLRGIYYYFSQSFIINQLKRYAHLVLVSNALDQDKLIKQGFAERQVLVAYGGVDRGLIDEVASPEKKYDAVFVGRLHPQKGFPDLIRATKAVARVKKAFRLALISDIPERRLISILNKHDLAQNIAFFGFKEGREKFRIMKESRILIFPSYYESFGMVAIEAMACALPVVAYDLPIYPAIYPQGMLKARIGDVQGLARHILNLLSDEALRERISKEAYALSQKFSWENTACDILKRLA